MKEVYHYHKEVPVKRIHVTIHPVIELYFLYVGVFRIWDVRPFAPKERCVKIFQGNLHNFEKNLLRCSWSNDGSKIAAGSADRFVYIWDTTSRRILYKLPGHAGSVNEVVFHPEESIVLSGASDKRLYMGEIQ
uniref:Uncharacterized protein n=1 Tax=Periophthalmus magnuspinnatus TaxID=409849 RepID=A0A3B3ZRM6_9GOBI